ncbi:MAG: phosphotransferase [Pseudomonadota bacterium]
MSLTKDETQSLQASLLRMGLIDADERPALEKLTGGVSSLIVLAHTRRGPVCIKRALAKLNVAADWSAPVERSSAEVAWMKTAMRIAPGTVPSIAGEDHEVLAFAMHYLDPADHPLWKTQLRDGLADPHTARAVAANLVAIHRGTAHDDTLAAAFANDESFHALRLAPYFGATALAHPECAPALQQLIDMTAQTKVALVHGDISPKNILVGKQGPVFLDAECAWYGDPAFDLAFCLCHLLLKCVWRPTSAADYLRCFDAMAEEYLRGVTWEPPAMLERRASRLLAAIMLARIDGKSPVEYITGELDRDRVRRFALRLVLAPAQQLSNIRHSWQKEINQ